MDERYYTEFEGTLLRFHRSTIGWVAELPSQGACHPSLLTALMRVISAWHIAGSPRSTEHWREIDNEEMERNPLEMCKPYERTAIASLLRTHALDQVIFEAARVMPKDAIDDYRIVRSFFRGVSRILLIQAADKAPDLSEAAHVQMAGEALADGFVKGKRDVDRAERAGVN